MHTSWIKIHSCNFLAQNSSSHSIFNVSISLSEQGVANWTKVVAELYQYVGMIRYHCQKGLPQWIYDELRSIQEVAHKYDDEQSPEDLVETLAEELSPVYNLPPDRLLDGTSLLFEYDPATIKVRTWTLSSCSVLVAFTLSHTSHRFNAHPGSC